MKKICSFLVKTIEYVFMILIMLILFVFTLSFCETITSGPLKYVIFLSIIIAVLFVFYFSENIYKKIIFLRDITQKISVRKMCLILFFLIAVTKIFFVFLFDNDPSKHPDMGTYYSMAVDLANHGKIVKYFTSAFLFPYEPIYALFLSPVIKLFGDDPKFLLSFLSILFAVSCVLIFDIIRICVGKNKAFIGVLLFNILPVGLFQTQLLTHENALFSFYIFSLWLFLKSINEKYHIIQRIIFLAVSALLLSFGSNINAGGYIVFISLFIYSIIKLLSDTFTLKKTLIFLVALVYCALCIFTVSDLCSTFTQTHVDKDPKTLSELKSKSDKYIMYGWLLYIGSNVDTPGMWNGEDAETYYKFYDISPKEKAKDYQIDLVKNRIKVFVQKPWLIPGHFYKKLSRLWSGVFLPFVYEQGNSISDFVLRGFHGIFNKSFNLIGSLVNIMIYSIIILSFKKSRLKNTKALITPLLQFKMMPIGLTMSLILFEVMPKYVSHMSIIMFVIAVFSYSSYIDNSIRFKSRVNKFLKRSDSGSPASKK